MDLLEDSGFKIGVIGLKRILLIFENVNLFDSRGSFYEQKRFLREVIIEYFLLENGFIDIILFSFNDSYVQF